MPLATSFVDVEERAEPCSLGVDWVASRGLALKVIGGGVLTLLLCDVLSCVFPERPLETPEADDEFVLYRRDLNKCVGFVAAWRMVLTDCSLTHTWSLSNGFLRSEHVGSQNAGMCAAMVRSDFVDHFLYLLRVQHSVVLQAALAEELDDSDVAATDAAKNSTWTLGEFAMPSLTIIMAPCAMAQLSVVAKASASWYVEGGKLVHGVPSVARGEGRDRVGCLTLDESDATVRACSSRSSTVSDVAEILPCSSPRLCGGRGQRLNGTCSCKCSYPWTGSLCTEATPEDELTCQERQHLGGSPEVSVRHMIATGWVILMQARLTAMRTLCWTLQQVQGPDVGNWLSWSGQIVTILMFLKLWCKSEDRGRVLLGARPEHDGSQGTKACFCLPFVGLLVVCVLAIMWIFVNPLLTLLLLFARSLGIWFLFPFYATVGAGHWPFADREILFCANEIGFSTFVVLPFCVNLVLSISEAPKALRQEVEYQDKYKLQTITFPFTEATKFTLVEVFNCPTVCGLSLSLWKLSRGGKFSIVGFLAGIYLSLAQGAEVLAMARWRRETETFKRVELYGFGLQDLPQFITAALVLYAKFRHHDTEFKHADQYDVMGILSTTASTIVQLCRVLRCMSNKARPEQDARQNKQAAEIPRHNYFPLSVKRFNGHAELISAA